MTRPDFRHDRPGTSASGLDDDPGRAPVAHLHLPTSAGRPGRGGRAPRRRDARRRRPDPRRCGAGWRVEVVSATAGEGSHPASPTHPPSCLRRAPPGAGAGHRPPRSGCGRLLSRAAGRVARRPRGGPGRGARGGDRERGCGRGRAGALARDGHPDHEAAGRAAAIAARRTDARLVEYPSGCGTGGAGGRAVAAGPDGPARRRGAGGEEVGDRGTRQPGGATLARAGRRGPPRCGSDRPLRAGTSRSSSKRPSRRPTTPWRSCTASARPVAGRVAATSGASGRSRWPASRVIDTSGRSRSGCSVGALAVDLAASCDRPAGHRRQPEAAACRQAADGGARPRRGAARWRARPVAGGPLDLVSISEVGYFLSPRQLAEVIRAQPCLPRRRRAPAAVPLAAPTGRLAARRARRCATPSSRRGATVLVEHLEGDFLLHVLGRPS